MWKHAQRCGNVPREAEVKDGREWGRRRGARLRSGRGGNEFRGGAGGKVSQRGELCMKAAH